MRCDYCGGRLDRPGFSGCATVEAMLADRRGLSRRTLDHEVYDTLLDSVTEVVRTHLSASSHPFPIRSS